MPYVRTQARLYIPIAVAALAVLLVVLTAGEVSADRQWDIHSRSDCTSSTTKGGVGVDCYSDIYLSGNSKIYSGRTVARADEDVDEISARSLGVEQCRKSPSYEWDSGFKRRTDNDYVSARGWARVTQVLCLPEGWLASHGLSGWHTGSLESSSESLEHHPTAIHS
ncbi:MAG: hypothetical protein OXL97_07030 [Chloroflexota bacterium]|nr:hypothetical protein [Chloroflexota bacterium]MDE2885993.1 hypothetical protein [Chloroflexota bacterium]